MPSATASAISTTGSVLVMTFSATPSSDMTPSVVSTVPRISKFGSSRPRSERYAASSTHAMISVAKGLSRWVSESM